MGRVSKQSRSPTAWECSGGGEVGKWVVNSALAANHSSAGFGVGGWKVAGGGEFYASC